MARQYETLFFMDSALEAELTDDLVNKIQETIKSNEGTNIKVNNWGTRTLAYEVDGTRQANYFLIEFEGTNETLDRLKRFFLINKQDVLQFSIFKKVKHKPVKGKKTVRPAKPVRESSGDEIEDFIEDEDFFEEDEKFFVRK